MADPQGFGVGQAERERAERERVERERNERERMERERVEQGRLEQDFLFRCLKPVETGYHRKFRCMEGTRQSLLNQITDWVANRSGQENVIQGNAYWLYSLEKRCWPIRSAQAFTSETTLLQLFSAGGTTRI